VTPHRINRLLLLSQALTLILLGAVVWYYRIPQKAWQAWVIEKRIPGSTPPHQLNRNYQSSRTLFESYQDTSNPILFFGDSHVRLVSWRELIGRNDLANRGIDGDTLDGIRERLADEAGTQPTALIFFGGTNDLLCGTDLQSMQHSMESLLAEARRLWPEPPFIITSIPPVAAWHVNHHRINAQARDFNAWLKSNISSHPSTHLLDLPADLADDSGNLARAMTSDGVHLSAQAYQAFRHRLNAVLPSIQPLF